MLTNTPDLIYRYEKNHKPNEPIQLQDHRFNDGRERATKNGKQVWIGVYVEGGMDRNGDYPMVTGDFDANGTLEIIARPYTVRGQQLQWSNKTALGEALQNGKLEWNDFQLAPTLHMEQIDSLEKLEKYVQERQKLADHMKKLNLIESEC